MTQSLREQLLQAGLVTEEQVKQVEQAKTPVARQGERRGARNAAPGKGGHGAGPKRQGPRSPGRRTGKPQGQTPRGKPQGQQASETPAPQAVPRPDARALKHQLRQLVAAHRMNKEEADVAYHFQVGSTIKHLYVTAEQQAALAEGRLCIAFLDGRRNLLPVAQGREILRIDPSRTVIFPGDDDSTP
ncbi:DUF2058 family protein [Ectothiorhodospira lacustris]|uniref:DUF2058 family protein n=1 Tax=Ectothiorhodospira lacustris TaxID=2899127 RepID=UPI001EE86307|nr:DUF2058 family protein [Ectothiorhodospira lacustris]MCG5500762.1 DUF2058 domain-containing protein [Ectothiorhodospira lacustris]MCG5510898.1 DUF2058 domain-containing protein [Ectothiorhodospira lacustris]MCG5522556.1 DUF2058 domain-containing protein [Ectothiorhodospira lacustris]